MGWKRRRTWESPCRSAKPRFMCCQCRNHRGGIAGPGRFLSVLSVVHCGGDWSFLGLGVGVGGRRWGQGCLLNSPCSVQSSCQAVNVATDAHLKERNKEDP